MSEWLQEQAAELAGQPAYELQRLILDVTRQIAERMEEQDVSQSELAKRLHVGRWRVSRILNRPQNLELKTLANVASALACRIQISIRPAIAENTERAFSGFNDIFRTLESHHRHTISLYGNLVTEEPADIGADNLFVSTQLEPWDVFSRQVLEGSSSARIVEYAVVSSDVGVDIGTSAAA